MAQIEEKVVCRTPTEGRSGTTSIPKWKYDCVRLAALEVIKSAGSEGLPFSKLPEAVRAKLSEDQLSKLGSLGWHVTTVKLNMEVEGEIKRLSGSPQRLVASI
ncbi:MAG: hypothetical protein AAFP97_00220 [Pseudomonadota bacterium]